MNGSSSEAQDLMEWFCGSPKTRRVPQEAVFGTECVFRTVEGCFWYRISLPYTISLFFAPSAFENASRTPGGCFWHRMRIPYRRRLFLVPSAFEGAGEGPAGDKFRVNGTQEMAEGAGANKESGVLSEANCCRSDCFFWLSLSRKSGIPQPLRVT